MAIASRDRVYDDWVTCGIVERVTIDDAKLLWQKTPEERKNEILWEVPDTLREQVAGIQEPDFADFLASHYQHPNSKNCWNSAVTVFQSNPIVFWALCLSSPGLLMSDTSD